MSSHFVDFPDVHAGNEHLEFVEGYKIFSCPFCEFNNKDEELVQHHIKTHDYPKPNVTTYASYRFIETSTAKQNDGL